MVEEKLKRRRKIKTHLRGEDERRKSDLFVNINVMGDLHFPRNAKNVPASCQQGGKGKSRPEAARDCRVLITENE